MKQAWGSKLNCWKIKGRWRKRIGCHWIIRDVLDLFSEFINSIFSFCSSKTFLSYKHHFFKEILVRQKVIISFIFQYSFVIRLYKAHMRQAMMLYMILLADLSGLKMTLATEIMSLELWKSTLCRCSEGHASCLNQFFKY